MEGAKRSWYLTVSPISKGYCARLRTLTEAPSGASHVGDVTALATFACCCWSFTTLVILGKPVNIRRGSNLPPSSPDEGTIAGARKKASLQSERILEAR